MSGFECFACGTVAGFSVSAVLTFAIIVYLNKKIEAELSEDGSLSEDDDTFPGMNESDVDATIGRSDK